MSQIRDVTEGNWHWVGGQAYLFVKLILGHRTENILIEHWATPASSLKFRSMGDSLLDTDCVKSSVTRHNAVIKKWARPILGVRMSELFYVTSLEFSFSSWI